MTPNLAIFIAKTFDCFKSYQIIRTPFRNQIWTVSEGDKSKIVTDYLFPRIKSFDPRISHYFDSKLILWSCVMIDKQVSNGTLSLQFVLVLRLLRQLLRGSVEWIPRACSFISWSKQTCTPSCLFTFFVKIYSIFLKKI